MKDVKITCDGCKNDITDTGKYRLVLSSEIAGDGGTRAFMIMQYPPIKRDYHFCSLNCLKDWING